MTAAAGSAKVAAGGAFERTVAGSRTSCRAATGVSPSDAARLAPRDPAPGGVAALALVVVVGGLGLAVYAFGGTGQQQAISSVNAGQAAIDKVRPNLAQVSGPGIDLITDDPGKAKDLLTEAYTQLEAAEAAKVSARDGRPAAGEGRRRPRHALRRRAGRHDRPVHLRARQGRQAVRPRALVQGPDDAPYVLDRANQTVYRIDLKRKKATRSSGRAARSAT